MSIAVPASFDVDAQGGDGSFSYDSNYQYDYLGMAGVAKLVPGAFGEVVSANEFVSEGAETLQAVSAVTTNPNSSVKVDVYLLDGDATAPTDGSLVSSSETTIEYGGYHTIELDTPVSLRAGQRFRWSRPWRATKVGTCRLKWQPSIIMIPIQTGRT